MSDKLCYLIEARNVLREWADREIISLDCIPIMNREQGCLSCEALRFFDVLDEDIAEQQAKLSGRSIPSPEEVAAAMTPNGGWTKAQLAEWGLPWPPEKGWRERFRDEYHAKGLKSD